MSITDPTPQRRQDIARLQRLSVDDVRRKAGGHLQVYDDLDGIHEHLARDMADTVAANNAAGAVTRFIAPVGPVGQYPIFLDLVHERGLSLRRCWFFFMDEYADDDGRAVPPDHPLSFAGEMQRLWLSKLDPALAMPAEQIVFPNELNCGELAARIDELGGIDVAYGGIGIHGHLAFNEPEKGVRHSDPRLVKLNDFTITINALRAHVGGNLEAFPRQAFTLGLRQILGARRLCFACRNGIGLDWANTVLRLTLLGEAGEDYPCTFMNQHTDYMVVTDHDTLACPEIVLE